MNPPDQPTPRTDAAWSKTFEDEVNIFWSGNAANKMRDECATLERELTRLRAEVERWQTVAAEMSQQREHNANEAARLRAEVERLTKACNQFSNSEISQGSWRARAEKAEAELITEQTRLDYLGLHMGTRMVAEALNCDYSKCFPIRDAIDLAMKNESNTL